MRIITSLSVPTIEEYVYVNPSASESDATKGISMKTKIKRLIGSVAEYLYKKFSNELRLR